MRKHFENSEPLATLWCDWSDAHLNFWREAVFAELSDILQLSACYNAACEGKDQQLPNICQFWDTTVFFSHVKVQQNVCKFPTKYPKFRVVSAKKDIALKKVQHHRLWRLWQISDMDQQRIARTDMIFVKKKSQNHICYLRPKHLKCKSRFFTSISTISEKIKLGEWKLP